MENPIMTLTMADGGKIVCELYPEKAPQSVRNMISLANKGFYDGLIFHRVISGFMIQGGCPKGTGTGVILAGYPEHVVPQLPGVPAEHVLQGQVEGVADVQIARDVGGGNNDGVSFARIGHAGRKGLFAFPEGPPERLHIFGLVALGQFFRARVAHTCLLSAKLYRLGCGDMQKRPTVGTARPSVGNCIEPHGKVNQSRAGVLFHLGGTSCRWNGFAADGLIMSPEPKPPAVPAHS